MADVLVPVGRHFFTPADLNRYLSVIPTDGTGVGPKGVGVKAAIDTEGTKVALLYSVKNGSIVARGAWAYEWGKGVKVGADLTLKF